MRLRNFSMAGAIALLACSVFALAGAMVFVASGSPASAASQDLRRAEQPMLDADRSVTAEGEQAAMAGVADCVETNTNSQWFGTIRLMCFNPAVVGSNDFNQQDVNSDGLDERVTFSGGNFFPEAGAPFDPCLVSRQQSAFDGEDLVFERECVLAKEQVTAWIVERFGVPQPYWAYVQEARWADLDGDRDLDLAMLISMPGMGLKIWIENTGFEHEQGLAGDLNDDGSVNGVDIAMLLADWTG
jgi:hypothetical protein